MYNWKDNDLIDGTCNLCKENRCNFLFMRLDGLRIVQCDNCGLVYLSPRPKNHLIPHLYNSDYFSSKSSIGFDSYFSEEIRYNMLQVSRMRLQLLGEIGLPYPSTALEIGCATGEFCFSLQEMGIDVSGIDISEEAVSVARSRYEAIQFTTGTIADITTEFKYDAIFAFEVIEHLLDPDLFFKKVSQILRPGGFLCITTPNYECAELVGYERWIGFSTSFEHLFFFSSKTINAYAIKHGMYVSCTLSGGGNGTFTKPFVNNEIKIFLRQLLGSINLLSFLRKIRKKHKTPIHDYQNTLSRHNLFMILINN
jgi:2-polyprenyl-3-methyl-5-hydroxy-6-metoxy-1,4-benzoquinol methylase